VEHEVIEALEFVVAFELVVAFEFPKELAIFGLAIFGLVVFELVAGLDRPLDVLLFELDVAFAPVLAIGFDSVELVVELVAELVAAFPELVTAIVPVVIARDMEFVEILAH
jgi:hypothetical protein